MTKAEAIDMCLEVRDYLTSGNPMWDKDKVGEALGMAIEALSEETSTIQEKHQLSEEIPTNTPTDLISRQDVYCILEKMMVDRPLATDRWVIRDIDKAIKSLPSAGRPKGEWNDIGGVIRWGCSLCHYAYDQRFNFCPNCGTDMRSER